MTKYIATASATFFGGNCPSTAFSTLKFITFKLLKLLNHVGINQYTAKIPIPTNSKIDVCLFANNAMQVKMDIIPTPVAADFRIVFRSLLKNFAIWRSCFFDFICNEIIPYKSLKVSLILVIMPILACSFSLSASASSPEECLSEITKYEKLYKIPTGLLKAVSKVESQYNPLALNDSLKQHRFKTKEEVLERISHLISLGKTNFDVGCMQINYYWHAKNFASIEEMLDVTGNVRYAASLIHGLYKTHGNWQLAVRYYHSYEPSIHKQYSKKIALAWLNEKSLERNQKINPERNTNELF